MSFKELGLSPVLCTTAANLGYAVPTPIQSKAIPAVLEGRDVIAGAQTGTGKTAAFALPAIQLLRGKARPAFGGKPRALVLTPTRELADQVHQSFRDYGRSMNLQTAAVFGGVGMQPQVQALRRHLDVVVATPGRLLDHMQQRTVDLSEVEILILDEADRMLDMGFLPSIRRVLRAVPQNRQTLLFSATFDAQVRELASEFMRNPVELQVATENAAASTVEHRVHPVAFERKRELVVHLLKHHRQQTLIFCKTRHGVDRLCRYLESGGLNAESIHGSKSQGARTRSLRDFKAGKSHILVATDIAARGLDIELLPMVINYDLPLSPRDYIHRIGRTGRAGANGQAVSLVCREEQPLLRDIQSLLNCKVETVPVEGFEVAASAPRPAVVTKFRPRRARR